MTIDAVEKSSLPRLVVASAVALGAWFSGLALIAVIFEPGLTVTIFGPEADRMGAVVRADTRIVSSGTGFTTVKGEQAGFVWALYAGGAWLALPGLGGGCAGRVTGLRPNSRER